MIQDSELQKSVTAELQWEPGVTSAHIGVTANAGVVTLTGHVENYAEKHAAEIAARRVNGVEAVAQEIIVRLPVETRRTDEALAEAVLDRLAWDVSVPRDAAKVKVESGWITLSGTVDWHFQKVAAEDDIHRLAGVVGVSNQRMVRPRANAADISDDILDALKRSWSFGAMSVTVGAREGNVRLSGTVRSLLERQVVESAAWAAPGVTHVENEVAVI